jgi:hypothetical protein
MIHLTQIKDLIAQLNAKLSASHGTNFSNPHSVTKEQVGLGNVENYRQIGLDDNTTAGGDELANFTTGDDYMVTKTYSVTQAIETVLPSNQLIPSESAVVELMQNLNSANQVMRFMGEFDAENETECPDGNIGDTYFVISDGADNRATGGHDLTKFVKGSLMIMTDLEFENAESEVPTDPEDWYVYDLNLSGGVVGDENAQNEEIALFDGDTGTKIKTSNKKLSDFLENDIEFKMIKRDLSSNQQGGYDYSMIEQVTGLVKEMPVLVFVNGVLIEKVTGVPTTSGYYVNTTLGTDYGKISLKLDNGYLNPDEAFTILITYNQKIT